MLSTDDGGEQAFCISKPAGNVNLFKALGTYRYTTIQYHTFYIPIVPILLSLDWIYTLYIQRSLRYIFLSSSCVKLLFLLEIQYQINIKS